MPERKAKPAAKPKVCITLPAYNAERTLAKTIADIPEGIADELILVDDHSPDNTAQAARDLGIHVYVHPENRRYGGNQKTCYSRALQRGADIVVLLHPDYQYDAKAVPLLIAPILAGHADMTFGSRFAATGDPLKGGMPLYRYLGNRLTTFAENAFLGSRFTEMHSGLRAYTRQCLLSLPFLSYSDDFVFDSQLLADTVTMGMRVVEVPIITRYTQESSSIAIGSSLRYVIESAAYTFKQGRARGRRGHRSPLTLGPPRSPFDPGRPSSEFPPPDDGPPGAQMATRSFARLLDIASGYWLPGRRLSVAQPADNLLQAARDRGWEALALGEAAAADVMMASVGLQGGAALGLDLHGIRKVLDREGALFATGPASLASRSRRRAPRTGTGDIFSPEGFNAALYGAGLRPVEWKPLGDGAHVLIVARPVT